MKNPLKKSIGFLGGGQLGRMFIENALRYDIEIHVLDPSKDAPCHRICHHFTQGSFKDFETVYQFGKNVDVLTIEIEHVNTEAIAALEKEGVLCIPSAKAIETIKDKGLQKQFYQEHDIPTAPFHLINNRAELNNHLDFLPFFQKSRKDGYDGKGVYAIENEAAIENAFDVPSLIEKAAAIEKEISVIVVRDIEGKMVHFPVVELVFDPVYNLVDYLFAPAEISQSHEEEAIAIARKVVQHLDSPGIFAIELFLNKDGSIWVNETAPRTHNSGHHTIEGSISSQFDQQLRVLSGLPLASTKSYSASAMINLVGHKDYQGPVIYEGIDTISALENVYVHLYGKTTTKPGRKMGHVSVIGSNKDEVIDKIKTIKNSVGVISQ